MSPHLHSFITILKKKFWKHFKLPLYKRKVLRYFRSHPEAKEYQKHLDYLKHHKVRSLLGSFIDKYKNGDYRVFTDTENMLPYVLHNEKKLYFLKGMPAKQVREKYIELLTEQDPESAHCYQTDEFLIKEGDILFDVGAAEGIIALNVIEKVKKVYLFEYDKRWIEALNATFLPWKDKVEIVSKMVADNNDDTYISIDRFCAEKNIMPDFIKIDVEGFEPKVLKGMSKVLHSDHKVKIAVCTYHKFNDAEELGKIFKSAGLNTGFSNGYMLYYTNSKTVQPPYFVRGLIRAEK